MNEVKLYQATGVAIDGRGLLLTGKPRIGKTSLALALIDRGATLIGDDGVSLNLRDEQLFACPPPSIKGKIEIRNVGIAELPTAEAPVSLMLQLVEDAPRLPETVTQIDLHGHRIPQLQFTPGNIAPAIRAEQALAMYGLT